jgi:hypothetical protein
MEGAGKAKLMRTGHTRESALSEEIRYARRLLPQAFGRYLISALRGSPTDAAKAAAVLVGFGLTVVGFMVGQLSPKGGAGTGQSKNDGWRPEDRGHGDNDPFGQNWASIDSACLIPAPMVMKD